MQKKILETEDIKRILPQRYPFLMIDRVIEASAEKVVAIKNVSINEDYFEGHFPEEKVMPGVLMIEAMAQAGIVLVHTIKSKDKKDDAGKRRTYFLGAVNKARFFEPVRPGEQLKIEVVPVKLLSKIGIISATVYSADKKIAQAEIAFGVKETAL